MNSFSIIIPVYNCEKYIDRCINSILPQMKDIDQLILVNDCSTDQTIDILEKHLQDKRIKIINKKKNQGVSKARNDGINAAKNDNLIFIDGDDYVKKGYLEFLRKQDENYSIITGLTYIDDETKNETNLLPDNQKNNFYDLDIKDLLHSSCNKTYRLDIIKNNNIKFNENAKMMEDYEFNLNYYSVCNKIKVYEKSFYYYSYHGSNSASSKHQINLFERYKEIKEKRTKFYNNKIDSNMLNKLNVNFLLVCINNLYKKTGNTLTTDKRQKILKEILLLEEFKKWKKMKKYGINQKIIYISTITENEKITDLNFRILHYLKNNFNIFNKIFRTLNKK